MENQIINNFFTKWETETIKWFIDTQAIYLNDYDRYSNEIKPHLSQSNRKIISGGNEEIIKELVAKDMVNKKAELIAKIGSKVGIVTKINVTCGEDGTPNGIVEGTEGKVSIETIEAGGYNIQCLHYRVLVKPVK